MRLFVARLSAQNLTNLRIWISLSCILQWPICFFGVSLVLALNFSTHFSIKYPRAILSIEQLWICRHSGHDQSASPLDTSTKHFSQKLWPQWVVRTGAVKISENIECRRYSNKYTNFVVHQFFLPKHTEHSKSFESIFSHWIFELIFCRIWT